MDKSQIICVIEKSLNYSLFDVKWIPSSAKFAVLGTLPNGSGKIQVYELNGTEISLVKELETSKGIKCGTFGASAFKDRHLATGDFVGNLNIWDIQNLHTPIYNAKAHKSLINNIAGIGGQTIGCGAPEIATCSKDGEVKIWDPRLKDSPVAVMKPKDDISRDCWCVAFGNAYNNEERAVCSGYDNGDIKLFDLRNLKIIWETNVQNGVVSLEFDRADIKMNKLVATTLESKIHIYDVRTLHPTKGFSSLIEKAHKSTIWAVKHLPQNREVFVTCGGSGSICLWNYHYPEKRVEEDSEGKYGVVGSVTELHKTTLSSQPISSYDWSPDKQGLSVCTSFDQTLRVLLTTRLNTL